MIGLQKLMYLSELESRGYLLGKFVTDVYSSNQFFLDFTFIHFFQ